MTACPELLARAGLFGQLIANTDMHDGNVSFTPGLRLAPLYDMLQMAYAPDRGMELAPRAYAPALPMPVDRAAWRAAAAALLFWDQAARDARISRSFRAICRANADALAATRRSPAASGG